MIFSLRTGRPVSTKFLKNQLLIAFLLPGVVVPFTRHKFFTKEAYNQKGLQVE